MIPTDSADARDLREREPEPVKCLRHPSQDALRYGLCRSCCAGLTESECMADADELRKVASR
jgi:hypothetical protein